LLLLGGEGETELATGNTVEYIQRFSKRYPQSVFGNAKLQNQLSFPTQNRLHLQPFKSRHRRVEAQKPHFASRVFRSSTLLLPPSNLCAIHVSLMQKAAIHVCSYTNGKSLQ